VKHPNIGGLVADSRYEKAAKLLPALVLRGGMLGGFQTLRPSLSRNSRCEVSELLGLQSGELIASLGCLQGTGGRLARRHQRRHLGTVGVEVQAAEISRLQRENERLRMERDILKNCPGPLPACAG
jgi:transposase-like protein